MIGTPAAVVAVAMSVIGASGFLIMPAVLGSVAARFGLDEAQVGLMGSALMAGAMLSAFSALFWVRSVNWKHVALLAFMVQMCSLFLLRVVDTPLAAAALLFAASLGGGAAYSLALAVLSDHEKADRWFGFSVAVQVAFQVLGLSLLDQFTGPGGFNLLAMFLGVLAAIGLGLSQWLPSRGKQGVDTDSLRGVLKQGRASLALLGCLFFFLNVGCVWTYVELMGSSAGFTPKALGNGLAVGVSVGILGALAAAWQVDRVGHRVPMVISTIVTVLAIASLDLGFGLVGFVAALAAYNFFWNYSLTYQYAAIAKADQTGRCVSVAPAFHGLGATLGPLLVSSMIVPGSFRVVVVTAIAATVVSLIMFLPATRRVGAAEDAQPA